MKSISSLDAPEPSGEWLGRQLISISPSDSVQPSIRNLRVKQEWLAVRMIGLNQLAKCLPKLTVRKSMTDTRMPRSLDGGGHQHWPGCRMQGSQAERSPRSEIGCTFHVSPPESSHPGYIQFSQCLENEMSPWQGESMKVAFMSVAANHDGTSRPRAIHVPRKRCQVLLSSANADYVSQCQTFSIKVDGA